MTYFLHFKNNKVAPVGSPLFVNAHNYKLIVGAASIW